MVVNCKKMCKCLYCGCGQIEHKQFRYDGYATFHIECFNLCIQKNNEHYEKLRQSKINFNIYFH